MSVTAEDVKTGRASGRRRRPRRVAARSSTLTTVLAFGLVLLLVVLIAVAITLGGRISALSKANMTLSNELFKQENELKELRPKLASVESELTTLLEGRFPHLQAMNPDKVIPISKQYVKNIVFTVVNRDGHRVYEYKLVMENPYRYSVYPNFRLLAFDKLGVQVGIDKVTGDEELGLGESRSHSSVLDIFMNSEPRYFAVHFDNGIAESAATR